MVHPHRAPYVVHPACEQFPLPHTFVDPTETCLESSWLRVRMSQFHTLITEDDRMRLCPIFALRTIVCERLTPISDYATVFKSSGTRGNTRYKYAEGLVNLRLTAKGDALRDDVRVLTVQRSCHKDCKAIAWTERVTVADIKEHNIMVHVLFTSFLDTHSECCVPDKAETRRPCDRPLPASYIYYW